MENKKVIIKEAVLATITGNLDSEQEVLEGVRNKKLLIEFEVSRVITCVVDEINKRVINIETNEIFPLLERDEQGRLKNFEVAKLNTGLVVALRLLDKEWDKMSILYQLNLTSRAKQVYERYLASELKDNQVPTLTKKRESK